MVPVLAYEVPMYTEARRQPRAVVNTLFASAAIEAVIGGLVLLTPGIRIDLAGGFWIIGVVVALLGVVLVTCAAVHARTAVYADRIETALFVGGLRVWRRRVSWGIVRQCRPRHRQPGDAGYKVWGRGPGLTVVMFGGDGVQLHLTGHAEMLIGSADPNRLAAAIDAALAGRFAGDPRDPGR